MTTTTATPSPEDLRRRLETLGLRGLIENWDEFQSAEWIARLVEVEEKDRIVDAETCLLLAQLRAFIEARGVPFAASWWGKIKLVVQANYCGSVIFYPGGSYDWVWWYVQITLWGTAISTVGSAVHYISRAAKLLAS